MGTMTFQLPAGLSPDAARDLGRACLAGGPDSMPWATTPRIDASALRLTRGTDESGFLCAPAAVAGLGSLMVTSGTLMERDPAYHLLVEQARGKVNQVRAQAADWVAGGLDMDPALAAAIRDAARTFGHAVCSPDPAEMAALAQSALDKGAAAGDALVRLYCEQVFRIRHHSKERLETSLACRLDPSVLAEAGPAMAAAFNRAVIPMSWHAIERDETVYNWGEADRLLDWAEQHQLDAAAGPLIDFSSPQLPAWLWLWERDLPSMSSFMCKFVETAVRRYRARVRRWHLTAGSNWASLLGLSEEELLGLTYRLGEAARAVDPSLELVIGIAQPWGEYMAPAERTSPFVFADHLLRSRLRPDGLELEVIMGVDGRGSYCRDALDLSRLLDLYALLGTPLSVTLGYPASPAPDPEGDPELLPGAGRWRGGFSPDSQADWANTFGSLALCKPYLQAVRWCHLSDAQPHQFPNCGLIAPDGAPRPALAVLRGLRERHLR